MAKTEVEDQISGDQKWAMIRKMACRSATWNGLVLRDAEMTAARCSTRSILSLNMNLNWKPTRIGENIIGNIISVRRIRWPRVAFSTSMASPRPEQHFEIEGDGQQHERCGRRPTRNRCWTGSIDSSGSL